MVTVASTGSAVAFLGVASGDVLGKPCRPKTASPARAVAPPPWTRARRGSRRGEPHAALRRADEGLAAGSPWFWFTRSARRTRRPRVRKKRARPKTVRRREARIPTDERDSLVALVAAASADAALRVYPANGAIRGERHTLKKASADERLVAAALVTPRAGGGDEEDANEKEPASAFAAVSRARRVLVARAAGPRAAGLRRADAAGVLGGRDVLRGGRRRVAVRVRGWGGGRSRGSRWRRPRAGPRGRRAG